MKKSDVLIIASSPRKNSNSTFAAKKLAENINKKYKIININNFFLKPCNGCLGCSKTFKCIIKDSFKKILILLNKAKIVIVASPVYFTGVPGQLKIFIDRNQQQWEKYVKGKLKNRKKEGYIILTSGAAVRKYFKPAESEILSFFAVNGIKCKKIFRFSRMDKQGEINKKKYLKKLFI